MVNNNPIGRAVLTAWCFWYVALFLLAAGYFGVAPWRVLEYLFYAAVTMGAGGTIGLSVVLAMNAATSHATELGVRAGDQRREAKVNLGKLPEPKVPPRRPGAANGILAAQPWWPKLQASFPAHAAAIRAVLEIMLMKPRLPASPVPGGHGGRTLIEHSLGVANEILVQAKGWQYDGQKDKRGRIRVKAAEPHRFTGRDAGLLVLTGLAHDIGKLRCYHLEEHGPGQQSTVRELYPNHDTEGARLLRALPEIMDLPFADRTALLAAVGYYHHAYSLPISDWVTDRVRSLTELLVRADVETGRKEGHTLSAASYAGDFEDGDDVIEPSAEASAMPEHNIAGASINDPDGPIPLDDEADALAMRAILSAQAKPARAPSPSPTPSAQTTPTRPPVPTPQHVHREVAIAMDVLRKPNAINGQIKAARVAWKSGDWIYVMEDAFRRQCQTHRDCPVEWVADYMQERSGNLSRFTATLLHYFAKRGELVDQHDGIRLGPERAMWRVLTPSGSKLPVFILRTEAIPGAAALKDATAMPIAGPFWGQQSARQPQPVNAGAHVDATTDATAEAPSASGGLPRAADELIAGPRRSTSAAQEGLASDDLPFELPAAAEAQTAAAAHQQSEMPPAEHPDEGATEARATSVTDELAKLVRNPSMFPFDYETREKNGETLAVIPISSEAGGLIGKLLAVLAEGGTEISSVRTARVAATGEKAYVIPLQD